MRSLFVGGHADGRLIEVDPRADIWLVPIQVNLTEITYRREPPILRKVEQHVDRYRRQTLKGEKDLYTVFLLEGLDGDNLMRALLEAYHQFVSGIGRRDEARGSTRT